MKHYASIRCSIARIGSEKETIDGEEIVVSNKVRLECKKNKTFPPFRKAEFFITFGVGIDATVALFEEAMRLKIIEKRGAWFSFLGEQIGQGKANTIQRLRDDKKFYADVEKAVYEKNSKGREQKKAGISAMSDDDDEIVKKNKNSQDDDSLDVEALGVEVLDV